MTAPPPTAGAPLDPRRHPLRDDLAATDLKGVVDRPRYVDGTIRRVRVGVAALRARPDAAAPLTSQAVFGDRFTVYDSRDGWVWGQCTADGYVGWMKRLSLDPDWADPDWADPDRADPDSADPASPSPHTAAATHVVTALRSFLFPGPDLKTPPRDAIPLGAGVTAIGEANGYVEVAGGWLFAGHLAPAGTVEPDPVATAERLIGVPYLWGGTTPLGIDCSGLAQLALRRAGIACPRDSDMQRAEVGTLLAEGDGYQAYRRGDLVFFPGHVGLMVDDRHLVHATAFTMTVVVEPLAAVVARQDPTRGGGILAVRRPLP